MKIKWFHNGIKLTKRGSNFKIKKHGTTLLFDNIKVENRGEYYCSVSCKSKKFIARGASPKAYLQVEGILHYVHTSLYHNFISQIILSISLLAYDPQNNIVQIE